MKKLIINADDFGYSRGVNYAILDSHKRGILTSTTLMAGMPGFEQAVEMAKETPTLGVGIHLTLTAGYPVLEGHKTLVKEDGSFPRLGFYEDPDTVVDEDEVRAEWAAQIKKILDAGIKPTHLDAHHHIHTYKNLGHIFMDFAEELGVPVRNSAPVRPEIDMRDVAHPELLADPIGPSGVNFDMALPEYREGMFAGVVKRLKDLYKDHDVLEVMAHPAYCDFDLLTGSSFNTPRAAEAEILQSAEAREAVEALPGVELASFRMFS